MCVRFTPAIQDEPLPGTGDAFPGSETPILLPEDGEEILVPARWGLVPPWAKSPDFGRKNAYNARAETIAEKPSFRAAFRHGRCVVPAKAFYERMEGRWIRLSPKDGDSFALAGLSERANDVSPVRTFTMVTTEPNERVADVHDRMPVVLATDDVGAWLDPEADPRELHALLLPSPPERLTVEDAGPVGGRRHEKGTLF